MFDLGKRGIVDLPVILVLCVLFGSLAIGLGLRSLDQFDRLKKEQKSVQSFDRLVETATRVSYGKIGMNQNIELVLCGRSIVTRGRLVQLIGENEVLESKILPLPVKRRKENDNKIQSGDISLSLRLSEDRYRGNEPRLFLELVELSYE